MKLCLCCCKCSPYYDNAVTYYENAAEIYHRCQKFKEEIYCLEQATICNRHLNESWKEGINYEKIATIYLSNLSKYQEAFQAIHNGRNALKSKGEYKDSLNCLLSAGKKFREMNQLSYANKCLKLAFDDCLEYFGKVSKGKADLMYTFFHVLDLHIALLFISDQFKEALDSANSFLKAMKIEKFPSTKISKCVGIVVICNLILGDNKNNDNLLSDFRNEDSTIIPDLERLHNSYINADKENFLDSRRMIEPYYDNSIIKKLSEAFQNNCKNEVNRKKSFEQKNTPASNENFADRYK